jgi:hypothetical protein
MSLFDAHRRCTRVRLRCRRTQRLCFDYAVSALHQLRRAPRLLVTWPHALYVNLIVHREYSSPLSRLQRSTLTTPRVRMPRHVARLITRLIAPLVVDYFASRRLVVDYSAYAARPGASACRAARHVARRRLLHLRRASGCLGTSRGLSSTTSTTPRVRVPRHVAWLISPLVVDYFTYAARPGASARRAARHAARRRLLRLRRASGCVRTSRGLLRDSSSTTSPRAGSSSTTSPSPRVRLRRHVAWLVARLVVRLVA